MMSGVIRGRGQNCSLRVLTILTSGLHHVGKGQSSNEVPEAGKGDY
jgi:hypothetical protein